MLDNAVNDGWNTQLSHTAVRLGDLLPDALQKFFSVLSQPRQCVLDGHPIYSRRSLVGSHPLVSSVQILSSQNPLKQVRTVLFSDFLYANFLLAGSLPPGSVLLSSC